MKVLVAIGILLCCQQLLAAKIPSPMELARLKLSELKFNLDNEIAGLPAMPELKPLKPFTSYKPTDGQVPDFEARKITLENLKTKLTNLQAAQTANGKPDKAFFVEMQKTLQESMELKMVNVKMPKFSAKKAMQLQNAMPVAAEGLRNVGNFSEEMNRLHEISTDMHRRWLDGTRVYRQQMVGAIGNVYQDLVQTVGRSVDELWRIQAEVQTVIDFDESIGAAQDCVDAQVQIFNDLNVYTGENISGCTSYVNSRGLSYLRSIFYPRLERIQNLATFLQYVVLQTSAFTNLSRDQEALVLFIDNELVSLEEVWNNNLLVLLGWEGRRYDDEMLRYRDELTECMAFVEERYQASAAAITMALNVCAVPTQ